MGFPNREKPIVLGCPKSPTKLGIENAGFYEIWGCSQMCPQTSVFAVYTIRAESQIAPRVVSSSPLSRAAPTAVSVTRVTLICSVFPAEQPVVVIEVASASHCTFADE